MQFMYLFIYFHDHIRLTLIDYKDQIHFMFNKNI